MKNEVKEMIIYEREEIRIGDDIYITILDAKKGRVKIGIDAPDGMKIKREDKKDV